MEKIYIIMERYEDAEGYTHHGLFHDLAYYESEAKAEAAKREILATYEEDYYNGDVEVIPHL